VASGRPELRQGGPAGIARKGRMLLHQHQAGGDQHPVLVCHFAGVWSRRPCHAEDSAEASGEVHDTLERMRIHGSLRYFSPETLKGAA
jgi:hypothetical protein